MDIASGQLGGQNPWSRYAPVLGLLGLAILWAAAASLTLFQLIRAAGEAPLVSLLQFGWLGYGLGLAVLYLIHIHRTWRATERHAADIAEVKNLLAAEIEARQRSEARLRQIQHELSDGETRYRTILETTDNAIIVADQHGRIEQFNNAAEGITGYLAAEVIGENMRVLLPPNLRDEHYRYTARYLWTVRELEVCRKEAASSPPNWRSLIGGRVDSVILSGCCVI